MKRVALYCNIFWLLFSVSICQQAYRLKLGVVTRDAPQSEAVLNVAVFGDVTPVIIINEVRVRDLPEAYEGGEGEEEADNKQMLLCWHQVITVGGWESGMFHR